MLLDTGLRVSELCGLTAQCYDSSRGVLTVVAGKGGRVRTVPLTPRAELLLETHWSRPRGWSVLTPRTCQRRLRALATAAGIDRPCSPHVLRHTFACRAIRRNVPLPLLALALGHSFITTTQGYLNLSGDDVVAAFRAAWRVDASR